MRTLLLIVLFCASVTSNLAAQMINTQTPFTTLNDSFFERMGVNFGFQLAGGGPIANDGRSRIVGLLPDGSVNPSGNLVFNQGGFNSAIPQFGGFDPNSAATFGYINSDGSGNRYSLGLSLGSGSTRSHVTQAPNVTTFNGATGTINDNTLRPFVTGLIPVIGLSRPAGYQPYRNWRVGPVYEARGNRYAEMLAASDAWQKIKAQRASHQQSSSSQSSSDTGASSASSPHSSANYGDLSVAEIKRRKKAERAAKEKELQSIIELAKKYEREGSFGAARYQYKRAIKRSSGELRNELQQRYDSIKQKK